MLSKSKDVNGRCLGCLFVTYQWGVFLTDRKIATVIVVVWWVVKKARRNSSDVLGGSPYLQVRENYPDRISAYIQSTIPTSQARTVQFEEARLVDLIASF